MDITFIDQCRQQKSALLDQCRKPHLNLCLHVSEKKSQEGRTYKQKYGAAGLGGVVRNNYSILSTSLHVKVS